MDSAPSGYHHCWMKPLSSTPGLFLTPGSAGPLGCARRGQSEGPWQHRTQCPLEGPQPRTLAVQCGCSTHESPAWRVRGWEGRCPLGPNPGHCTAMGRFPVHWLGGDTVSWTANGQRMWRTRGPPWVGHVISKITLMPPQGSAPRSRGSGGQEFAQWM